MVKAVIFDMDGTLVDSEPLHEKARNSILEKFGIDPKIYSARAIGKQLREYYDELAKEFQLQMNADELTKWTFEELMNIIRRDGIPHTEGSDELLQYLHENSIQIAVASSSDRNYIEFILQFIGWDKLVSVTACGDEVARAKPAPDVYLKALEELGITPDEAIAVEDTHTGSRAAKSAELRCVGFDAPQVNVRQNLSECTCRVNDLREVISLIGEGKL